MIPAEHPDIEGRDPEQPGGAAAGGAAGAGGAVREGARDTVPRWAGDTAPGGALRMGGIALKNGLILLSEGYWAAAIREKDGSISVASGNKPHLVGSGEHTQGREAAGRSERAGMRAADGRAGIPLLRGLGRFGESLLVMAQVKVRMPHAELPLEGGRVAAALAGSLAATSAVRAIAPKSALVQEAGGAVAAFLPAVLALKNSPISGYHGAEHKVIGGREAALAAASASRAASRADAARAAAGGSGAAPGATAAGAAGRGTARSAAASKEHDRCGSNLVGPFMLATVATNLIVRGRSGRKSPVASALAGAVSLGAALEALRWASKNGDSILARLLLMPGRALQRHLTTTEPSPDQLEVGEAALRELLRLEGVSN